MQISTQSRKRLLFAALFLAILVPLFFTLEIRSQLPLLGFEGGSPLIDWVHQNTTGSGFLRKVTGDATFYSLVLLAKDSRLGALLFFQSIACASIALVLLWLSWDAILSASRAAARRRETFHDFSTAKEKRRGLPRRFFFFVFTSASYS